MSHYTKLFASLSSSKTFGIQHPSRRLHCPHPLSEGEILLARLPLVQVNFFLTPHFHAISKYFRSHQVSFHSAGKTLAYLLPIFEFLLRQKEPSYEDRKIQALVLAPTRELALQVQGECNKLLTGKCGILVGGLATQKQERVLRKNKPPIIIATPGRLWEMVSVAMCC